MTLEPHTRVWRYMSFAKLVWMLQEKELWLSSAEDLGDNCEVTLDSPQLSSIINERPPSMSAEEAKERALDIVRAAREKTFVSCWTASEHESHALWRIYCPSPEGIAIQTTLERLRKSVGLRVMEVSYGTHGADGTTLDVGRLVAQKRPMFAYEQEVRAVLVHDLADPDHPERRTFGTGLKWDPEAHVESIRVHPEAQFWFMETVTETVGRLAPKLSGNVSWSEMNLSPPA